MKIMKNKLTHLVIHEQQWYTLTRYILSCEEGTITLEIYKEPQGENKVQAYICNFWVKEPYRRQGIGTQLLLKAESIAKEKGHKEVWLEWFGRDTDRFVLLWYLRNGYDEKEFGSDYSKLKKVLWIN